jgi:hypothetical protein
MAGNISGNAYALTILSPIKNAVTQNEIAYADLIRDILQSWNHEENSPMVAVPNTYLCRFFVLDDVYTDRSRLYSSCHRTQTRSLEKSLSCLLVQFVWGA